MRAVLNKTPNATIDERLLGIQLDVQETAAKTYINELRAVGLLTDENKATPLAHKWRLKDTYSEASRQIIQNSYPESLIHVAPPGEVDRQRVVAWFQREGLGQGSAGNKASTYLLLSSLTPSDAPKVVPKPASGEITSRKRTNRKPPSSIQKNAGYSSNYNAPTTDKKQQFASSRTGPDPLPLNINVQIHISADAGTEQIESIFQAMRRYLYDSSDS